MSWRDIEARLRAIEETSQGSIACELSRRLLHGEPVGVRDASPATGRAGLQLAGLVLRMRCRQHLGDEALLDGWPTDWTAPDIERAREIASRFMPTCP